MSILMIPLLALLILIASVASTSEQDTLDMQQQESVVSGGSLRIYANAVARFAKANPAFSGTAPGSALDVPAWYSPQLGTSNIVAAGTAYVFFVPGQNTVDLYRMFPDDEDGLPLLFGFATNGLLSSPSGGAAILALPPGIPDGAIVYVL